MFRFRQGVKIGYDRQGYVYFVSRCYKQLPKMQQAKIRRLCADCGGPHGDALLEFVTTDTTATAVTMKYYLSRATLYRIVRKYYEKFPRNI